MIRKIMTSAVTAACFGLTAQAQNLAITNAKVWTGTDAGTLESATVIIIDGRVSGVGVNLAPPSNMRTVNADGKWVTPGLIAPYSRAGIVEVGAEASTNDISADASEFSISLLASDSFNPSATNIPVTRIEGITRIAVAPGNGASLFAGQGFVADTSGQPDSITLDRAFVYVDLAEYGAALAGGSRAATWATLRGAIDDARGYPSRYITDSEGDVLSRSDAQAFVRAVRGQQLVLVDAHRASDIRKIIDLKAANSDMNVAIVGAAEGWLVADELAGADIPVIVDPFANLPASFEQLGATAQNAQRLIEAGVTTAFAHLGDNSHQTRLTPQSAGNAVANGVSFDDAMMAITAAPAEIFGMDGFGTIQPGSAGDLVMWDGDPLEVMSAPELILIDGQVQSMESRQTKLRQRYLDLDESERPIAFRR